MSSTKELRNRIKSIKNTSKVTKAMELVSAAKMRRAQEQALNGRSYSQLINKVLSTISGKINPETHPLLSRKKTDKHLIMVISTDRGFVGAMNSNLFKLVVESEKEVTFATLGKKAEIFVSKVGKDLVADFLLPEKPSLKEAKEIATFLIRSYLAGEFNKVSILYTQFKTTLQQISTVRQILPILNEDLFENVVTLQDESETEYLFEPSADIVLESILPHYIEMEVYQVLLEATASEHSARMVAMKNASDNAGELVDDLTLVYNGLRQAAITNEILDITTAALALE